MKVPYERFHPPQQRFGDKIVWIKILISPLKPGFLQDHSIVKIASYSIVGIVM